MKKIALYIVSAILLCVLLLFLSCGEKKGAQRETKIYDYGNTSGNILHGGIAAEDDEFIYFSSCNPGKSFFFRNYCLCKMNKISGEVEVITKCGLRATYINVCGEYLFYCDSHLGRIIRVRKDGKQKRRLSPDRVENFMVIGDRIYYRKADFEDDREELYSMDLDGKDVQLVADGVEFYCIDKNEVYYINAKDNYSVWKTDIYGKDKNKLFEVKVSELLLDEKYIYYVSYPERKLYKADKQTLTVECIFDGHCADVNIYDNRVYYTDMDDNKSLYHMAKNGFQRMKVAEGGIYDPNIVENRVFCQSNSNNLERCYIDLTDGKIVDLPN